MSTLKTTLILSGLYCVLAFENTAVGQVDIVFSDGTTTGTTFNVDVGTTQTISVIAAETETGTALSTCLLYTSPSPRDRTRSRMPSSA